MYSRSAVLNWDVPSKSTLRLIKFKNNLKHPQALAQNLHVSNQDKLILRVFCFFFFSGTAGDALGYHSGLPFSTKDRDNDGNPGSCAWFSKGAWWYDNCHDSNLNGLYIPGNISDEGMAWQYWKNNRYSVKASEMKIRPIYF